MSYKERLKFLKWPNLHQWILFSSPTECYKTVKSLDGPLPFEYFTPTHDFRPLTANHCHKLKPLPAKLNSFMYSFFVNGANEWNNNYYYLPKEVAEAESLKIFKNRLRCHFTDVLRKFLDYFNVNFIQNQK